jgi:RimJ/RimL family protein N-acetyltransferase
MSATSPERERGVGAGWGADAWTITPGGAVALERITPERARAVAGELFPITPPDTFRYFLAAPAAWTPDAFTEHLVREFSSSRVSYAVRDRASGAALGSTSFLDVRLEHRGVEIGFTWYSPSVRGTLANPECKFLLLRHAFESLGCVRVQLKCDARNAHSRAAILKLGATFEGILRRHMIVVDGFIRDTAMYSITDDEWPRVKAGLIERLGCEP